MVRGGLTPDSLLRHRSIAAAYEAAPLVSSPDTAGTPAAQLQTLRRQLRHDPRARRRGAPDGDDSLADVLSDFVEAPAVTAAWVVLNAGDTDLSYEAEITMGDHRQRRERLLWRR